MQGTKCLEFLLELVSLVSMVPTPSFHAYLCIEQILSKVEIDGQEVAI